MENNSNIIQICSPGKYTDDGLNDVFIYIDPCACDTGECDCDCGLIPILDVIINGESRGPISSYHYEAQTPCEPTDIEVIFGECPKYCIKFCCGADPDAGVSGRHEVCFPHEPSDQEIIDAIADDENGCGLWHSATEKCLKFCVEWTCEYSYECELVTGGVICSGSGTIGEKICYDEMPTQDEVDNYIANRKSELIDDIMGNDGCSGICEFEINDCKTKITVETDEQVHCCDGRVFDSVEEATAAGCKKIHIPNIYTHYEISELVPISNIVEYFTIDENPPYIQLPTDGSESIIVKLRERVKICPNGEILRWAIDCDEDEPPCPDVDYCEVIVNVHGCPGWNNIGNTQVIADSLNGTTVRNITVIGGNTSTWNTYIVEQGSTIAISSISSRIANNCCLKSITINDVDVPSADEMTSYIVPSNVECPIRIDVKFGACILPCVTQAEIDEITNRIRPNIGVQPLDSTSLMADYIADILSNALAGRILSLTIVIEEDWNNLYDAILDFPPDPPMYPEPILQWFIDNGFAIHGNIDPNMIIFNEYVIGMIQNLFTNINDPQLDFDKILPSANIIKKAISDPEKYKTTWTWGHTKYQEEFENRYPCDPLLAVFATLNTI